jgi:hypothetical protein
MRAAWSRDRTAVRDTIEGGNRGVAQSGSASALGAEGRGFESLRPDHPLNIAIYRAQYAVLNYKFLTATVQMVPLKTLESRPNQQESVTPDNSIEITPSQRASPAPNQQLIRLQFALTDAQIVFVLQHNYCGTYPIILSAH